MLTGENGILNRATDASKKTNDAGRKEKADLDRMSELIDETVSGEQTVKQVTDKNPGVLEEDGNEKVINSIEDLVFFAWDVTNGNTYEEQNVKLGLSLDFNSSKSYVDPYRKDYGKYGYNGELKTILNERGFIPIGKISRLPEEEKNSIGFKGIFDGNNCKIYNLKINQNISLNDSYVALGFFSINNGKIKNLRIEKSKFDIKVNTNKYHSIGILVGHNVDDGIVENCSAKGDMDIITSYNGNIGGLCGANDGSIRCCSAGAEIETKRAENANQSGQLRFGGVVGANSKNIDGIYFNGVLKLSYLNNNELSTSSLLGGLVGYVSEGSRLNNSYSVGFITNEETLDNIQICPLCFSYSEFGTISENCYYLKDTISSKKNEHILSNYPAVRIL